MISELVVAFQNGHFTDPRHASNERQDRRDDEGVEKHETSTRNRPRGKARTIQRKEELYRKFLVQTVLGQVLKIVFDDCILFRFFHRTHVLPKTVDYGSLKR